MELPRRRFRHQGPLLEPARWDDFIARADDIFISTPAKCGTTWTQAIVASLIFGRADHGRKPAHISPWLDADFTPWAEIRAMLAAQTHRRFIKTHTPLDGMPFHAGCVHLAVYRDPRDAFFSSRAHAANMDMAHAKSRLALDPREAFRAWCEGRFTPGGEDVSCLERTVHHYRSFKAFAARDEIHLLHFADMKRDLAAVVRRLARILGIEVSERLLAKLVAAASFENMKRNASQFVPDPGSLTWKQDTAFFARGANAQWREVLSAAELALYEARLAELLPAAEARWLNHGDEGDEE